jgi:hypothetical protein
LLITDLGSGLCAKPLDGEKAPLQIFFGWSETQKKAPPDDGA